jgi:hypothetical protein
VIESWQCLVATGPGGIGCRGSRDPPAPAGPRNLLSSDNFGLHYWMNPGRCSEPVAAINPYSGEAAEGIQNPYLRPLGSASILHCPGMVRIGSEGDVLKPASIWPLRLRAQLYERDTYAQAYLSASGSLSADPVGDSLHGLVLEFADNRWDMRDAFTQHTVVLREPLYDEFIVALRENPLLMLDVYARSFPEHASVLLDPKYRRDGGVSPQTIEKGYIVETLEDIGRINDDRIALGVGDIPKWGVSPVVYSHLSKN